MKRGVSTNGSLNRSLKSAYGEFKKENPNKEVGLSTFAKLRPKNVKLLENTPVRQCVCQKCANFELSSKAIAAAGLNLTMDKFIAINQSLCPFDQHPHMECVKRNCKSCGVKLVRKLFEKQLSQKKVSWCKWMPVFKDKKRKIGLVKIDGSLKQLFKLHLEMLHEIALHLFVATWQCKQFQLAVKQVDEGRLVQVLDFAQNKLLIFQDEAQAAHWQHDQCTIHPVVNYYKCEKCDNKVQEDVIMISDDLKHDSHAVKVFQDRVHEHLTQTRDLIINKIDQFTDGASAQYKSIKPFTHLSNSHEMYGNE